MSESFYSLVGVRVYLRPVCLGDATDRYAAWLNDSETTRYLESGERIETPDTLREYIASFQGREDAVFLAIVLHNGNEHVGNIKLEPIQLTHRRAEMGVLIGSSEARGRGIGSEAIRLLLKHAFDNMGLHRVTLGVRADNLPAIRCYERIGFRTEGVFREAVWDGAKFVDSHYMGILASEFDYGE